jgi:branched-chain amino acid transport system permease protein
MLLAVDWSNLVVGVLQQVVSGLASGGIFASLALALVLIHNAMETLNFAQGEMAMFSSFIAWALILNIHLPLLAAFAVTIVISIAGGIALKHVVIKPVERAPILSVVIVTIGIFALVHGLAGFIWGDLIRPFPSPFPTRPVQIAGVYLGIQDLGLIATSVVLLLVLFLFFQRTQLGLAMRSSALYPDSSRLMGVRVSWMLALGWGLAAGVGAVSGLMVAPILLLSPLLMQSVLLYAFAGAVLGGINNPGGAVIGSLIVGVLLAVIGTYVPGARDLRLAVALLIIVGVLIVKPGGIFGHVAVKRV